MEANRFYKWDIPHTMQAAYHVAAKVIREALLETVCAEFETTCDELRGKVRERNISDARCVYSYLARTVLGDTLLRIGRELNKDHTTVINQLKRMDNFIETKHAVALRMRRLEEQLLKTKQLYHDNNH